LLSHELGRFGRNFNACPHQFVIDDFSEVFKRPGAGKKTPVDKKGRRTRIRYPVLRLAIFSPLDLSGEKIVGNA
jgi:hypothetical protein